MSVLKRRTSEAGAITALAAATFEYVELEGTAVLRLSGTSSVRAGVHDSMTLVITRAGEEHAFPGVAESSGGKSNESGRAVWQVAFTAPLGLVQSSSSHFGVRTGAETTELPRPSRHQGRARAEVPAAERNDPAEDEPDPEARVRQAEAAIDWTQRQLSREREARKKAEDELAVARPEIDARRRELEHVAALEVQTAHLAEERERRVELENQVAELSATMREIKRDQDFYEQLKVEVGELTKERDALAAAGKEQLAALDAQLAAVDAERERRFELEVQLAEAVAQRDRLLPLEHDAPALRAERDEIAVKARELEARVLELEERLARITAEPERSAPEEQRPESVDTERVGALEQWIADLRRALAEARDELQSSEEARAELRAELSRMRAAVESAPAPEPERAAAEFEPEKQESPEPVDSLDGDDGETLVLSDVGEPRDGAEPEPEPEPEPEQPSGEPTACTACDALGSCRRCGGRGKRFGRRCAECNGTGTCPACGGPGYIWTDGAVAENV